MIFLLILIYTNSILAQDGKFKNIRQVYLWDVTLSMYGFTNDASYKAKKIDRLDMNISYYDANWSHQANRIVSNNDVVLNGNYINLLNI